MPELKGDTHTYLSKGIWGDCGPSLGPEGGAYLYFCALPEGQAPNTFQRGAPQREPYLNSMLLLCWKLHYHYVFTVFCDTASEKGENIDTYITLKILCK